MGVVRNYEHCEICETVAELRNNRIIFTAAYVSRECLQFLKRVNMHGTTEILSVFQRAGKALSWILGPLPKKLRLIAYD